MWPDEVTLLAYVDDELSAAQRAQVEAALAQHPGLMETVQALRASKLPYEAAFAQQTVPPVPAALRLQVESLAARHSVAPPELAWAGAGIKPGKPRVPMPAWGLLLLLLGLLAGYWGGRNAAPSSPEPWLQMVSSYHAMYGRETVLDGGVAQAQVAALASRLQQAHGLALKIPDLQAQGLQFVRAQQLQHEGQMVLQLVYLPASGPPLALCLMPAAAQPERSFTLHGQQGLAWFANGWAYVLIGQAPAAQLQTLRSEVKAPIV
jgi:anti-sigma factor RsiW